MLCLKCGTLMDAVTEECPRCKRLDTTEAPITAEEQRQRLEAAGVITAQPQTAVRPAPEQSIQRPPVPQKNVDEIFCQSCGRAIKREAVICVFCGVPVPGKTIYQQPITLPKDRTIAIVLAIFFSFFTYLYTYRVDYTKFWLHLLAVILTCGIWAIVAWLWSMIEAISRTDEFYLNYPNG